jgi:RNA polymerase sigma factor (TIGR02999 family)
MSDVTRILSQIEQGDPQGAEQLLPLVYDELRKLAAVRLAQEKTGQTLQATALVHEAYVRLVGPSPSATDNHWNNRAHFFGAAAEAMRRILIDRARDKARLKRSGQRVPLNLDEIAVALDAPPDDLLALDEVLGLLESQYADCAQLVKLRFFAGLSQADAAATLGIPRRTADRLWSFARAWLFQRLRTADQNTDS